MGCLSPRERQNRIEYLFVTNRRQNRSQALSPHHCMYVQTTLHAILKLKAGAHEPQVANFLSVLG